MEEIYARRRNNEALCSRKYLKIEEARKVRKNEIIQGDVIEVLKTLPDECVDCVVTSPPYWGLRDYGTVMWEGGNPECDHVEKEQLKQGNSGGLSNCPLESGEQPSTHSSTIQYKEICPKCGAKRIDKQIGLEKTPEEYVAKMVEIFREVRRVLKNNGTMWLILGDSYAGGGRAGNDGIQKWGGIEKSYECKYGPPQTIPTGLKSKDLVGIPWRVAFALQSNGWWLRQDIIWEKPNSMPESVTDRCTKSHEYIFLLTKNKNYYFDNESIKEKGVYLGSPRLADSFKRIVKTPPEQTAQHRENRENISYSGTRNKRSVWTISTKPFSEAHFATFPPELPEICIKAGCPEGGICLDPFMGSGTVAVVAKRLKRNYLGIELNPEFIEIAKRSIISNRDNNIMKIVKDIQDGKQKSLEMVYGMKSEKNDEYGGKS